MGGKVEYSTTAPPASASTRFSHSHLARLLLSQPSLADIGIYYRMSSLREGVAKEVLNPFRFPKITSIIENFAANKRIAAWNKAHEE